MCSQTPPAYRLRVPPTWELQSYAERLVGKGTRHPVARSIPISTFRSPRNRFCRSPESRLRGQGARARGFLAEFSRTRSARGWYLGPQKRGTPPSEKKKAKWEGYRHLFYSLCARAFAHIAGMLLCRFCTAGALEPRRRRSGPHPGPGVRSHTNVQFFVPILSTFSLRCFP